MVPSLTYNRGGLPSGEKEPQEQQQLIYEVFTSSHFSLKFYISLILSLFNTILFSFFFFQWCKGRRSGNKGVTQKVSVSPHFSWSERKRHRGSERKEKRSASRVCSWQLFQQPISLFFRLLFCSCVTSFDQSVHIFNVNVRYNCCKKTKRKSQTKKKKTLLARVFYFVPLLISKVLFVSFLC